METLDNNILGTNKIPGSEKFTRPEEIKALSKYLKKIHSTQDEHTSLGEESLALFGRKTGKLVEIENLSDHAYLDKISDDSQFSLETDADPMLKNESKDVVDLLQEKIKLVESEDPVKKLDDRVDKLSVDQDIDKLPSKAVEINPNEAPEDWTKKLLKDVIKIQGNKEITELSNDRVDLETPERTIPLSTEKDKLDVDEKVQSLTPHQKLEELTDLNTVSLSTKKEILTDQREIELPGIVDKLKVVDNTELSDYKEKINDERSINLENHREDIQVTQELELPDDKDTIHVEDKLRNLPEDSIKLSVNESVETLPDSSEKLSVEDNPELSDHKETLEDKREAALSDYRERIDVSDIDSLSDKKLDLKDDREINLSKEKLGIEDEREIKKLPNEKEDILSNYGLSVNKLPTDKDPLKNSETKSPEELSKNRLDLVDDRESELDSRKKKILGDIPEIDDLTEEKIQILEGKNREPDELNDKLVGLNVEDLVSELPTTSDKINQDNIPEITDLSQFVENLDVNTNIRLEFGKEKLQVDEKVDHLEDGKFIIDNDNRPPIKLHDEKDRLSLKSDENKSPISNSLKNFLNASSIDAAVDEIVKSKSLDNTGLFNRIMKLLQDIKKDGSVAVGSTEWINKTEALVTSYFNSSAKYFIGDDDKNKDNFIENWIDSITVSSQINERNRKSIPTNDSRQIDPYNTKIIATSGDGSSDIDNLFSYLVKAKTIDELSQLLKFYKFKVPNLYVPENSDENGASYRKFKEDVEDYDLDDDGKVVRAKILPATIQLLQDLIKERGGNANVTRPDDANNFDKTGKDEYTYAYKTVDKNNKVRWRLGFDYIGALINSQNLDQFKKILASHNSSDPNPRVKNPKIGISENESSDRREVIDAAVEGRIHARGSVNDTSLLTQLIRLSLLGSDYDRTHSAVDYGRPYHQVRDARGNWVASLSDPLEDEDGNVLESEFKSHQALKKREKYHLPSNADFGNIAKGLVMDNGSINPLGIANLLTNPGSSINLNKYLRLVAEKITDAAFNLYTGVSETIDKYSKIGKFKLGGSSMLSSAITQYTGIPLNKRRMLEETLGMLVYIRDSIERNTNTNRDRLPGSSLSNQYAIALANQGTKGIGDKLVAQAKAALKGNSLSDGARNRPEVSAAEYEDWKKGEGLKGNKDTIKKNAKTFLFGGTTRPKTVTTSTFVDNGRGYVGEDKAWGDKNLEVEYKYKGVGVSQTNGVISVSNRFAVPGVLTTLSDLCNYDITKPINTLEDFKKILINSPNITTPGKFGSTINGYKSQTLSSNSFWEIKLEPFVHKNMNGGYSYLPSIREINVCNLHDHGIFTGYNEWLPITSFELEKSKLATKSLGIFEGEIVYPVGCEFLNELSMTMINDSLKSWSGFWRRVMEVSTHNSEPHTKEFYEDPYPLPTVIDQSAPVVALYKNVTWRCQIFILSPQYSTIRKFDLLVVLKDFTESYAGEIDSPGNDVQLRFSIVGENPPEENEEDLIDPETAKDKKREEYNKKRAAQARKEGKEAYAQYLETGDKETYDEYLRIQKQAEEDLKTFQVNDGEVDEDAPVDEDKTPPNPPAKPTDKTTTTTKTGNAKKNPGNGYYKVVYGTTGRPYLVKGDMANPNNDPNAVNIQTVKDPDTGNIMVFSMKTNSNEYDIYGNTALGEKFGNPNPDPNYGGDMNSGDPLYVQMAQDRTILGSYNMKYEDCPPGDEELYQSNILCVDEWYTRETLYPQKDYKSHY
jgi:hypothetical protein